MPTKPKLRFSIATLFWLMVCVAVFFGGRWSREIEFSDLEANVERLSHDLQGRTKELQDSSEDYIRLLFAQGSPVVVDVSDGDTVSIVADKKLTRVRVVGIDCPESNQPFGDEAKQFTMDFCMSKEVELIGDQTDRYGRRLADVLVDGKSLREALLSAGLAWHYKKYNDDAELAKLEDDAKAAKFGLWADEDAVPPWEWRK